MNGLLSAFASAVLLVTSAFTGAVLMEENGNVWAVEKNQSSEDNSLRTNDVNLLPLVNNLDEADAPHIKSTTGLDNHFKPGVERQEDIDADNTILDDNFEGDAPPVFYSAFVKLGDFMEIVTAENAENLNRDPIFRVDEYMKFDGVDGEIMCSASVGSTVLSFSMILEDAIVTVSIAESVCKGKYVPDGRNDGKVFSLKNVQLVSIQVDSLLNGPTQDVPVFYKPHYTDWTGRVVATHAVMDAGNLGDLVYKASQNNSNNAEAAIDPNETSDTCDNVDGDDGHSSGSDGDSNAVKIPYTPFGPGWVNIAIWILNQDWDDDGDTMVDDIIEWIVNVFTQDEEGNEEGGEEEGDEDGGEEEGGEEEGGEEEGDEDGGGEDGGGSDTEG